MVRACLRRRAPSGSVDETVNQQKRVGRTKANETVVVMRLVGRMGTRGGERAWTRKRQRRRRQSKWPPKSMSDPTLTHDSLPSAHVLHAAVVAFANTGSPCDTWKSEFWCWTFDLSWCRKPRSSRRSRQSSSTTTVCHAVICFVVGTREPQLTTFHCETLAGIERWRERDGWISH